MKSFQHAMQLIECNIYIEVSQIVAYSMKSVLNLQQRLIEKIRICFKLLFTNTVWSCLQ